VVFVYFLGFSVICFCLMAPLFFWLFLLFGLCVVLLTGLFVFFVFEGLDLFLHFFFSVWENTFV